MEPTNKEDSLFILVQGCIRQDRGSQKELYKQFYSYSMRICQRYASNAQDAAGILNDGFYKIFTNIDKYDFEKPFLTWLHKIMTNTAIDFYRSNLRFSNSLDIADHEHPSMSYEFIEAKLNYDDLLAMVRSLSTAYRTVFNLYVIEGYTHEEIAGMLNISVGSSKSNLFKARAKLAIMVKDLETSEN